MPSSVNKRVKKLYALNIKYCYNQNTIKQSNLVVLCPFHHLTHFHPLLLSLEVPFALLVLEVELYVFIIVAIYWSTCRIMPNSWFTPFSQQLILLSSPRKSITTQEGKAYGVRSSKVALSFLYTWGHSSKYNCTHSY